MKEILEERGIIRTGHFQLTSGKHSSQYINKDVIYSNPALFNAIVMKMTRAISPYGNAFDVITGPAIAGAVLAAPISLQFINKVFVYPEKIDNEMAFRRGYDNILKGKRIWIVEDIITTGGSIEKTIAAIVKCGGEVVGVSAIWNRGSWSPTVNIPFLSLINEFVPSYFPNECPECKAGIPLRDPKR